MNMEQQASPLVGAWERGRGRSRESGGRLEADDDAPDNAKRPQGPGHVRSL
jgi:hypothetical protein